MSRFDAEKTIMTMYVDSAKGYVQLSTGLLALSTTFREKVLGGGGGAAAAGRPGWPVLTSWVLLLATALLGMLYQYLAVKYLDRLTRHAGADGPVPEYLLDNPGIVYGAMCVPFFSGVVLLVAGVWQGHG